MKANSFYVYKLAEINKGQAKEMETFWTSHKTSPNVCIVLQNQNSGQNSRQTLYHDTTEIDRIASHIQITRTLVYLRCPVSPTHLQAHKNLRL